MKARRRTPNSRFKSALKPVLQRRFFAIDAECRMAWFKRDTDVGQRNDVALQGPFFISFVFHFSFVCSSFFCLLIILLFTTSRCKL